MIFKNHLNIILVFYFLKLTTGSYFPVHLNADPIYPFYPTADPIYPDKNKIHDIESDYEKCRYAQKDLFFDSISNNISYFFWLNDYLIIKNESNTIYQEYYRYVQIFNTTMNYYGPCKKIESLCLLFKFERVVPTEQKILSSPYFYKRAFENINALNYTASIMLLSKYFQNVKNSQCESLKGFKGRKLFNINNPNKFYFDQLLIDVINNYNFWNYRLLNNIFFGLGLITNFVSFSSVLYSRLRPPKIDSSNYYLLFFISNIIYLITFWLMNIKEPSDFFSYLVLNRMKFFEIFFCKILTSINMTAYYISDLIIVSISMMAVLYSYFPFKVSAFAADHPYVFNTSKSILLILPLVSFIFNSVLNTVLDPNAKKVHFEMLMNYFNETYSYGQYCKLTSIVEIYYYQRG